MISLCLQESYARSRENPYFKGLLRDDTKRSSNQEFIGRSTITRSTSDLGDIRETRKTVDPPLQDSDVVLESLRQSSSKLAKQASFSFLPVQIDLGFSSDDLTDSTDSSPGFDEENGNIPIKDGGSVRSVFKKSFSLRKGEDTIYKIPLPQSAASFFSGYMPIMEVVESCESINLLNSYLKMRRDDVNAGAPGKFLHAVLAQDVSGNALCTNLLCQLKFILMNYLLHLLSCCPLSLPHPPNFLVYLWKNFMSG